jgi:hypothetical protein
VQLKPVHDKRSRLQVVARYIQNGTVLFPRSGCEKLLDQVFNLGVESHDDLCDGLTYLIPGASESGLGAAKDSLDRGVNYAFMPGGVDGWVVTVISPNLTKSSLRYSYV